VARDSVVPAFNGPAHAGVPLVLSGEATPVGFAMTNEQLVERLRRSVRRWRRATLVLGLLLSCSLATGGTVIALLMVDLPEQREMHQNLDFERHARRAAEQAQRKAEDAKLEAEEARRQLQRQLEAARNPQ
jgi:hypothetical protein